MQALDGGIGAVGKVGVHRYHVGAPGRKAGCPHQLQGAAAPASQPQHWTQQQGHRDLFCLLVNVRPSRSAARLVDTIVGGTEAGHEEGEVL